MSTPSSPVSSAELLQPASSAAALSGPAPQGAAIVVGGAAVGALLDAAVAAAVEASPHDRDNLVTALRAVRDALDAPAAGLDVTPQLGRSRAAVVMAPFAQQVATDADGLQPRLRELMTSLDQAITHIERSMGAYTGADADAASAVTSAGPQAV